MRPISDTITRLSRLRRPAASAPRVASDRLFELQNFGTNPGALRGWLHAPQKRSGSTGLVVVLHGCTQTAAGYDLGSGWSDIAEQEGFVVLFPEQQRQNNPNLCFNWFNPGDAARGAGEALSIFQMIETAQRTLGIDPGKVFVTGLSAGGAMANVMLAAYPEVFAGGAIIAGLPFGCARSVPEAFERMRGLGGPGHAELALLVRRASGHAGPWPTVSVWHGDADATVSRVNAEAIAAQWCGLHGAGEASAFTTQTSAVRRTSWRDAGGHVVVERFDIPGMGHGTPLKVSGTDSCGSAGPFMLDVGISSTIEICRSWKLLDHERLRPAAPVEPKPKPESGLEPGCSLEPAVTRAVFEKIVAPEPMGKPPVTAIIEDALRKAGLMR